jgi:glucose/arabinose dehydrogenase
MYSLFARLVALIGDVIVFIRHQNDRISGQAVGQSPSIPSAKPQGGLPTLKMPTARGWHKGQTPVAADGLKVNAFAAGLKHPRWIQVMPNGDVLVAEALSISGPPKTLFDMAMISTMKRAAALGESANRISLLRDTNGDGVAEINQPFMENLNQPFGMALLNDQFYVGNTDGLMVFPYQSGADHIRSPGRKLTEFNPGGHWTRSLLPSPDGKKIYIGVGSLSNIGEHGMEAEEGRAAIYEFDVETEKNRIFASGLRNAVGLAWEPKTSALWTVVNERDGLGDETPPDYLTSVKDGGFYGWPFCYWGQTVDDRVPQDEAMVASALQPDYALGGHTASLGLCWMPEGTLPGFPDGMVIGQHGSWNRSKLSGYRVVFIPFINGKPSGAPRDILSGFLAPDERVSYGRPVGVTLGHDQKSLLVADDVGNVIWRVTAA